MLDRFAAASLGIKPLDLAAPNATGVKEVVIVLSTYEGAQLPMSEREWNQRVSN